MKNQILQKTRHQKSQSHYNDGMVDYRLITPAGDSCFHCMAIFVNCSGDSKIIDTEDNFFSPLDLVKAYQKMFWKEWNMEGERASYVEAFKKYLIRTGCPADELEGE